MREPLPSSAVWRDQASSVAALAAVPAVAYAFIAPAAMTAVAAIAIAAIAAAPASLRVAHLGRRMLARHRARGATATVRDAIAAIAAEPSGVVTVRGRVRTRIAARGEAARCAVRLAPAIACAGRFVVEDATGAALVDDDALVVVAHLGGPELPRATIADGQEVIVRGRARVLVSGGEYRAADRTLAFDGTAEAPLEIVPL